MRRVVRLIAVLGLTGLGLLLAGVLIGPSSAGAAPAGALAAASCSRAAAYPPSAGATVMASTTTPFVGQTIEVSGTGFCAGEAVDVYIGSKHVGSTHADANGSFDPPVVVPGPPGKTTLLARGPGSSASLALDVRARSGGGTAASGSSSGSGGGLAFTGVEIGAMIAVAALLLGGGLAMMYAGRRKRLQHS